ncbi:hypothetical protein ALC57_11972, partial [Trachymyrmex cornetzi]
RNPISYRISAGSFLSTSLEKLASYLNKDKLKITWSEFFNLSAEDFDHLTGKSILLYEYIDCIEKLEETELPSRELFCSLLTCDTVSEGDYAHAVNIWQSYGLDPAYYYTLPGFTWNAILKHTHINPDRQIHPRGILLSGNFELLTDVDMVLFIEPGIRGGLNQCSHSDLSFCPTREKPSAENHLRVLYYAIDVTVFLILTKSSATENGHMCDVTMHIVSATFTSCAKNSKRTLPPPLRSGDDDDDDGF